MVTQSDAKFSHSLGIVTIEGITYKASVRYYNEEGDPLQLTDEFLKQECSIQGDTRTKLDHFVTNTVRKHLAKAERESGKELKNVKHIVINSEKVTFDDVVSNGHDIDLDETESTKVKRATKEEVKTVAGLWEKTEELLVQDFYAHTNPLNERKVTFEGSLNTEPPVNTEIHLYDQSPASEKATAQSNTAPAQPVGDAPKPQETPPSSPAPVVAGANEESTIPHQQTVGDAPKSQKTPQQNSTEQLLESFHTKLNESLKGLTKKGFNQVQPYLQYVSPSVWPVLFTEFKKGSNEEVKNKLLEGLEKLKVEHEEIMKNPMEATNENLLKLAPGTLSNDSAEPSASEKNLDEKLKNRLKTVLETIDESNLNEVKKARAKLRAINLFKNGIIALQKNIGKEQEANAQAIQRACNPKSPKITASSQQGTQTQSSDRPKPIIYLTLIGDDILDREEVASSADDLSTEVEQAKKLKTPDLQIPLINKIINPEEILTEKHLQNAVERFQKIRALLAISSDFDDKDKALELLDKAFKPAFIESLIRIKQKADTNAQRQLIEKNISHLMRKLGYSFAKIELKFIDPSSTKEEEFDLTNVDDLDEVINQLVKAEPSKD